MKYRKVAETHSSQKLSLDQFNVQIGKLKGYSFLLSVKNQKSDLIRKRISLLEQRCSIQDTHLVDLLKTQTAKKRSMRLYFTNVGRVAAYKCITKGLQYEHVIEYLAIALVKSRTWELVYLTC